MKQIEYPTQREVCSSSDHYFNMIVDGACFSCNKQWGLSAELPPVTPPSDEEINDMYAAYVESESEAYRIAH